MADILSIVLEIILDGALEAAGSKKVPLIWRVLLAGSILLLVGGVCILLILAGADSGNWLVAALGAALLAGFALWTARLLKNRR